MTSRLSDALRNGRVWQLAIIYLTIQVAVYGLIFFLPTRLLHCWGQSGLYGVGGHRHSVGCGLVWDGLFRATPIKPANGVMSQR